MPVKFLINKYLISLLIRVKTTAPHDFSYIIKLISSNSTFPNRLYHGYNQLSISTACRISAGASPRPTYAWQAEHPAVHRMRLTGQLPRPIKIQQLADRNDLPVAVCYFSDKDIAPSTRRFCFSYHLSQIYKNFIFSLYPSFLLWYTVM